MPPKLKSASVKLCRGCSVSKPIEAFHKKATGTFGRSHKCAECMNAYKRNRADRIGGSAVPAVKRRCVACGADRPAAEFRKHRYSVDGYAATCKGCHKAATQKYKAANRAAVRQQAKRYRNANKTRLNAESAKRYEANKERYKEVRAEWRRAHPGEMRIYNATRRVRELAAPGPCYTVGEWRALLERYGHICLCCKTALKLTADHVIPLSRGGAKGIENIQPLCMRCNQVKGTRVIDYRAK